MATVTRYTALITTVDPSNGVVGFVTKGDAQERRAIVLTTAVASRWPIEGETWLVRQENGSWYIDQPLPSTTSYEGVTPGDAIINSPTGRVHVLGSADGGTDFSFTGSDPAGGDLSGNYPNPSVQTVLNGMGAPAVSQDVLQNGVISAGDFAVSGISVNAATGAITCTVAAGVAWVKDAGGLLRRVVRASSGAVTLTLVGRLPPSGNSRSYLIEADSTGAFSIYYDGHHENVGNGNIGPVQLAGGTIQAEPGKFGIAAVSIYNNAGTYQLSVSTTLTQGGSGNWIDRRPWARGLNSGPMYGTGTGEQLGNAWLTPNNSPHPRFECSGAPLEIRMGICVQFSTAYNILVTPMVDGVNVYPVGPNVNGYDFAMGNGTDAYTYVVTADYTPAAGSHTIFPAAYLDVAGVTVNIYQARCFVAVREIVAQTAYNGLG